MTRVKKRRLIGRSTKVQSLLLLLELVMLLRLIISLVLLPLLLVLLYSCYICCEKMPEEVLIMVYGWTRPTISIRTRGLMSSFHASVVLIIGRLVRSHLFGHICCGVEMWTVVHCSWCIDKILFPLITDDFESTPLFVLLGLILCVPLHGWWMMSFWISGPGSQSTNVFRVCF